MINNQRYNQLISLSKFLTDLAVSAIGFSLAISILAIPDLSELNRGKALILSDSLHNMFFYWGVMVIILQIIVFWFIGLYKRDISFLNFEEIKKVIKAIFLVSLISFLVGTVIGFNLVVVTKISIFVFLLTLFLVSLERYAFYKLAKYNHKKGKWINRVAIYDVCPTGKLLLKKLFESPQFGYCPIGFIDNKVEKGTLIGTNSEETKVAIPVLGKVADIKRIIRKYKIEEIFIATPAIREGDIQKISFYCKQGGINYRFIPNLLQEPLHRASLYSFGGIPFIKTEEPQVKFFTRIFKRILDLTMSISVLVLLGPIFLSIGFLISLDSKGPIIFKQKRAGRYGKPFIMYKFRTMKKDAPKYAYSPTDRNDERITNLGRFLRKSSLDELPQFFNVLKGEMSVVGPRPEMLFIAKNYNAYQRERLLVKPGITGIWQVTADRKKLIHENLDYDIYYIDNISILLDFLIIIRTIWFAFKGIGAV